MGTGATVATEAWWSPAWRPPPTLTTVFAPTAVAPVPVNRGELRAVANIVGLGQGSVLGGFSEASGSRQLPFGTLRWSSAGKREHVASLSEAEAATGLPITLPRALTDRRGCTDLLCRRWRRECHSHLGSECRSRTRW